MKSFSIILLTLVVLNTQLSAGPVSGESKVRIGVMNLEPFGEAEKVAGKATENLVALLEEVGFYDVIDEDIMSKSLEMVKKSLPRHCSDPRCVLEVGIIAGMDRMIYGTIDINNKKCGIRLTLVDVLRRQTIESVSLEGAEGVSVEEMLKVAIARLHGHAIKEPVLEKYYGPEIHNEKQFLASTIGMLGAGLIWGIVNYSAENNNAQIFPADYPDHREELSGISSSADQIPLFARPAALANAYVAASDDAYGVLYNPAGMAWVAGPQAAFAYQYRFGLLDNLAATYVNKATREIGFGQALLYSADRDEGIYTEMYFVTAAAYKVYSASRGDPSIFIRRKSQSCK